ncbi:MAG: ankyrin repeat domain-containing protein [Verrucomicrobiia bacterium]
MNPVLRNLLLVAMVWTMVAAGEHRPKEFTTEMHKTVEAGDLAKVKRLLDARPEWVNEIDGYAHTPLHIAAFYCRNKEAELLLRYRADINARNLCGQTPLHSAADQFRENPKEIMELLLLNGADVNAGDDSGETPLHVAVQSPAAAKTVVEVLLTHGADVNARSKSGSTPLHNAGNKSVAEALLAHGADANAKSHYGDTPLHKTRDGGVAEVLLRHKANIEAMNLDGWTPLYQAVFFGRVDVARVLLTAGANPDVLDRDKLAPLHHAVGQSEQLVKLLLAHKANVNLKTNNGYTPLQLAMSSNRKNTGEILLAHEVDVNCKNAGGDTALHEAAGMDKMDVLKLLLARKADINAENDRGQTPLDMAVSSGHRKIADFLREHGGKTGKGIKKIESVDGGQTNKTEAAFVLVTNAVDYARVHIEPQLTDLGKKGKWDETNLVSQVSAWLVKELVDLTGEWGKTAHDDCITLALKKRNDGKYDVEYNASGDMARWTLKRTGFFDGGVLSLDRPVQGYIPRPASRFFYLLRTPIGVRLTEQHAVREWIINKRFMRWPQIVWDQFKADGWDDRTFLKKKEPEKQKTTTRRGK